MKKNKTVLFENSLELTFLGFIFLSIFFQVLLGKENIFSLLLRYLSVAGMFFLSGIYTASNVSATRQLVKRGGLYGLLFLCFGIIHQVFLYHNNLFVSIIRLLTLQKVPEPSSIFFTISILFLFSSVLSQHAQFICTHPKSLTILSILSLGIVFVPKTLFDYAIIGVFLGTDNYNCIPLLPFLGYYFAGYFLATKSLKLRTSHLLFIICFGLLPLFLYQTPLKKLAPVVITMLPVCFVYLLSKYCYYFQILLYLPLHLIKRFSKKLHYIFFDSFGSFKKTMTTYLIVYTFLFGIISLLVFSPFWTTGTSLIWEHDTLSQYIPKAYYYINYIHDAIQQCVQGNFNFSTYDFQIGLGNAVTFTTDPVYLLLALFPASKVEFAYSCMCIFRLYLTGLSMSIFLYYFKRSYYESLYGSFIYAFSGYALYVTVIHAQFLAPMILFPFLLIATEEIFQKKRWYICTIFVAISLLSSYYFLYMNTLSMGLYYVLRFVFTKDKEKQTAKYFVSTTLVFAGSYLLGVLIGNLSFFTSFSSYLGSGRTVSTGISTNSFFSYGTKFLSKFLVSLISTPGSTGYSSKYGFVPIVFIAVIVLFMKKGKKNLKALFVLYTAFCVLPIAGFIFSGFSVVTNRWGYMYSLLIAFITSCILPELKNLSKRELKVISIGVFSLTAIAIFDRNNYSTSAQIGVLMLLVCYIIVIFVNENIQIIHKKYANCALLILCIICIIVNSHLQYTIGDTSVPDNFVAAGDTLSEIKGSSLCAAETIEDSSFYRVAPTYLETKNINSSLITGFNSVNTFSSTVNGTFVNFNRQLANSTWTLILYKGFDNRTILNELTNVKYITTTEEFKDYIPFGYTFLKKETIDGISYWIYENNYPLPFGYTYSSVISEDAIAKATPIEKQEILLQSACVENDSSNLPTADWKTTSQKLSLKSYQASDGVTFENNEIIVTQKNATLTLYFDGPSNSEVYLVCNKPNLTSKKLGDKDFRFDITRNDTETYSYFLRANEYKYATYQEDYLYNLGYHEDGLQSCTITFKTAGTLSFDSLEIYAQPMNTYTSYIDNLTKDVLQNVEINSNSITGNISLSENKFLVTAIPYQKGWTAYVDGKEIDIHKANYMFSGLYLTSGEHTIEFRYELPGIRISLTLAFLGIIIFISILLFQYRHKKRIV